MARVRAEIEIDLPDDAHVGDDFTITGDARIILIRDPQVDVTTFAIPPRTTTVPGEREYELLVLNGRAIPRVEAATAAPGELR